MSTQAQSYYDQFPRAGHETRYKRPTTAPGRIADWEKWRESIKARDEEVLNKLGRGKVAPHSVNLLKLKYKPLPAQYRFHASNAKHKGFSGSIGCIAGETKLDGSHSSITVAELCRHAIAPTVNTLEGPTQAEIPYLKGYADLYEVRLTTGESMLVTLDHLFYTQSAQPWQSVRSLSAGDCVLRTPPAGRLDDTYINYNLWGVIESIRYVRTDDFYDLSVPGVEHYTAHGFVSHNSGKSMALAYEALYLSALSPNCAGYVTAPTHTMLRDAAQTAIIEMLELEGVEYDYKGGEYNVITFKRGDPNFDSTNGVLTPSQIYFRTASNPDRLRGPNIAWFGMDEMTYSDEEAWKILVGRIRHPRATQHNGFGCWTPKGYDWVYKLFINPAKPDPNFEMIYSRPGENYHLPDGFYESLRSQYDEAWAKQEIEGGYLRVFQGQVYHSYDPVDNVQPVRYVPGLPLIWTLDFNVNPFCTVLLQRVDGPHQEAAGRGAAKPWAEIWAVDELVLRNGNTYQMCDAFLEKTRPWVEQNKNRIDVHLYGDATGARDQTSSYKSDWNIIRDWFIEHNHLFNVHWHVAEPGSMQNPPIRARVNAVNAALCDSNGIRRLLISPRCTVLLNDLQSVAWRTGDTGLNMDEGTKRELTHASDALGYYVVHDSYYFEQMDYMRQRLPGL